MHRWAPMTADDIAQMDPEVAICRICGERFRVGDVPTLLPLGPGADREARAAARSGRVYNAVAVLVHLACATGEE